jgi:hypothetical protein
MLATAASAHAQRWLSQASNDPLVEFDALIRAVERGGPLDDEEYAKVCAAYRAYLDEQESIRVDRAASLFDVPRLDWNSSSEDVRRALTRWTSLADQLAAPNRTLAEEVADAVRRPDSDRLREHLVASFAMRRYDAWRGFGQAGQIVQIIEAIAATDVPASDVPLVDDAMFDLRRRLAALLPKLEDAWITGQMAVVEVRRGFVAEARPSIDDEAATMAWRIDRARRFRAPYAEAWRIHEKCFDALDASIRSLAARVSAPGRRAILASYSIQRYQSAEASDIGGIMRPVRVMLAKSTLDPTVRSEVRAVVELWRESDDAVVARLLRLFADRHRAEVEGYFEARDADELWRQGFDAEIARLYEERTTAAQRTVDRAVEILDLHKKALRAKKAALADPAKDEGGDASTDDGSDDGSDDADGESGDEELSDDGSMLRDEDEEFWAGLSSSRGAIETVNASSEETGEVEDAVGGIDGEWLRLPPSLAKTVALLDRPGADRSRVPLVESFHAAMTEARHERLEPALEAVRAAQSGLYDGSNDTYNLEAVPRYRAALASARSITRSIEDSFFESLLLTAGVEERDAAQAFRAAHILGDTRRVMSRRNELSFLFESSDLLEIQLHRRCRNLAAAVRDAELLDEHRFIAERIIAEHADRLIAASDALEKSEFDASMRLFELDLDWNNRTNQPIENDDWNSLHEEFRVRRLAASRSVEGPARAKMAVEASIRDELRAVLSDECFAAIERAERSAVYNGIDVVARNVEEAAHRLRTQVVATAAQSATGHAEPTALEAAFDATLDAWRASDRRIADALLALGPVWSGERASGLTAGRFQGRQFWWTMRREQEARMAMASLVRLLPRPERRYVAMPSL